MITIDSHVYDVGTDHESLEELMYDVIARTNSCWDNGADIVIFPEYIWLNAVQYKSNEPEDFYTERELSEQFWTTCWPILKEELSRDDKTVILGTCPRIDGEKLMNTAPIIREGDSFLQDKLALTPWEYDYTGGSKLNIFNIGNKKCAVLICLDIEMPEIAAKLKEQKVDLILVPSATETMMGSERVTRCASSRAIEMGSAVVVSALCGHINDHDFMDSAIGRSALYLPSLSGLETAEREQEDELHRIGTTVTRFEIDEVVFEVARHETQTTNPANITLEHSIKFIKEPA